MLCSRRSEAEDVLNKDAEEDKWGNMKQLKGTDSADGWGGGTKLQSLNLTSVCGTADPRSVIGQ